MATFTIEDTGQGTLVRITLGAGACYASEDGANLRTLSVGEAWGSYDKSDQLVGLVLRCPSDPSRPLIRDEMVRALARELGHELVEHLNAEFRKLEATVGPLFSRLRAA
jgi:hypothetical protein